jgi:hypothetical protein
MDDDWESFFQNDVDDSSDMEDFASKAKSVSNANKVAIANKVANANKVEVAACTNNNSGNNDNKNNYDYSSGRYDDDNTNNQKNANSDLQPKCTDIYISTKTKISYFNKHIILNDVFWSIPVMPYHTQSEGVIKKQMKFNSSTQEELDSINQKVREYTNSFVEENVITQIINPTGRIKFKDVRKISIGLRKKDITSHRCKKKSAFYNCFVVILRIREENDVFREINAKVFNTGKIEIPGIQTKDMLDKVLTLLTSIIKNVKGYEDLTYDKNKNETVLINSNFTCNYYVNREKLYNLIKYKYKMKCAYDPCSYPGILCEFYYDPKLSVDKQTGRQPTDNASATENAYTKVSFMIFRTGSVLIVGKCEEDILNHIYLFIKNMLENEYVNCYTTNTEEDIVKEENPIKPQLEDKSRKVKRNIIVYTE